MAVEYPTTSANWAAYGEVLVKEGRRKEALQIYQQALALDPGNAEITAELNKLKP